MKEEVCTELVCRAVCRYFRQGRETMQCGTYGILKSHLSTAELETCAAACREMAMSFPDMAADQEIRALACETCEFLVDGCDFREDRSGPPCGGYYILERLLKDRDSFLSP